MSDFHNEKLRALARRTNCESMSSEDAFVQGFMMGRCYQREMQVQIYNQNIIRLNEIEDYKYDDDNWWNKTIASLENKLAYLKRKHVIMIKNNF